MNRALCFVAGTVVGALVASGAFVIRNHFVASDHLLAQEELVEYEQLVVLGMPLSDAAATFSAKPFQHIKLSRASQELYVETPDFLARNWVLRVEAQGDRVSAVRYRTPDGAKPPGSPADRVTKSARDR